MVDPAPAMVCLWWRDYGHLLPGYYYPPPPPPGYYQPPYYRCWGNPSVIDAVVPGATGFEGSRVVLLAWVLN
ncbi:MAG: hypothetical protein WBQ37_04270 [Candidatus Competibacter sp.]